MQNTILVVGPGTPASTIRIARAKAQSGTRNDEEENEESNSSPSSSSSSFNSNESSSEEEGEEHNEAESSEDEHTGDDESVDEDNGAEEGDSDDDDNSSDEFYEFIQNNYDDNEEEEDLSDEEGPIVQGLPRAKSAYHYHPSMRHGGCINTAAWLTSECGWRLSTVTSDNSIGLHAVETEELCHQVVTSGDDRLLKVWDVSEPMGISSPLAGGTATLTPFSSSYNADKNFYRDKEKWQSMYDSRRKNHEDMDGSGDDYRPPGTVRLLTTLSTGHRGNVFHVTPLKGRPGVFATCGADGFLRLVDVERSSSNEEATSTGRSSNDISTVVVHPMYDYDSDGSGSPRVFDPENPLAYFLRNSSGMCFSHVMLDDVNVGLLCSEKGLLRFDLRLSPREQCNKSLLPKTATHSYGSMIRSVRACKACAILPNNSGAGKGNTIGEGSTYIFAGGSSPSVALCDIRMTAASTQQSSSGSRVLQYYQPMSLSEVNDVSVSGLDLSRDGKELLVSYESDQIYTFPIFPYSESPRRSATDQLTELLNKDALHIDENNEEEELNPWGQGKRILPELATYGAHMNRYTFLKNARYAGPRDEYICTGSDSGHAWIYEKASGAVVSFWKADQSTCNGVVPHSTLPIFVTYGIDSTAKLWRSTTPVDPEVDDSVIGRRKHFRITQERSYEMTPTVRHWGEVQTILENLDLQEAGLSSEESEIFPDEIPCSKVLRRGRLVASWSRESSGNGNGRQGIPKIGNDLQNLPDTLKGNLYTVIRSLFDDNDVPVESDTEDFKRRVSLIRLRHQADSLGLTWNPTIPWLMEGRPTIGRTPKTLKESPGDHQVEPSELVPEYPSDWIPYDAEMSNHPFDFRDYFCGKYSIHDDFYRDRYYALDERGVFSTEDDNGSSDDDDDDDDDAKVYKDNEEIIEDFTGQNMKNRSEKEKEIGADIDTSFEKEDDSDEDEEMENEAKSDLSNDFVRRSSMLLSENVKTLKDGGNAAFKAGKLGLAAYRYDKAIQYGSVAYMNNRKRNFPRFDSLLKNLIMSRLNMALVLLNEHFMELKVAAKQAKLALQEVSLFCDIDILENQESLDEALALKAKACFRLGSAQYEMGDYHDSIASLEKSIKSTNEISKSGDNTPDSLVLRRLGQAKRELLKHTRRQRKKFKFAFTQSTSEHSKSELKSAINSETLPPAEATQQTSSEIYSPSPEAVEPSEKVEAANLTVSNPLTQTVVNSVTPMNSPATEVETGLISSAKPTKSSNPPHAEERNL